MQFVSCVIYGQQLGWMKDVGLGFEEDHGRRKRGASGFIFFVSDRVRDRSMVGRFLQLLSIFFYSFLLFSEKMLLYSFFLFYLRDVVVSVVDDVDFLFCSFFLDQKKIGITLESLELN